jgi:hypothetical protein
MFHSLTGSFWFISNSLAYEIVASFTRTSNLNVGTVPQRFTLVRRCRNRQPTMGGQHQFTKTEVVLSDNLDSHPR